MGHRKNAERLMAVLMTVIMIVTFSFTGMVRTAGAQDENSSLAVTDPSQFEVSADGTITSFKGNSADERVVIPPEVDGKTVTAIGNGAFRNMTGLSEIVLPDAITGIGDFAFEGDTSLKSMVPYYSVDQTGTVNCGPVRSLVAGAGISLIMLPSDLQELSGSAFNGCTSIARFAIEDDAKGFRAEAVRRSTNSYESSLKLNRPEKFTGEYTGAVQDSADGNNEKTSGEGSTASVSEALKNATADAIGNAADDKGDSVTPDPAVEHTVTMGEYILTKDGKKLVRAAISPGDIGTDWTVPEGVEVLGDYSFAGLDNSGNHSFKMPSTLQMIGDHAFEQIHQVAMSFTEKSLSGNATGNATGNSKENSKVNATGNASPSYALTFLGSYVFYRCGILDVELPASVTGIGAYTFAEIGNIHKADISKTSITVVPEGLFSGDSDIHTIELPASVKTVENGAFRNSSNLDTVNFLGETLESLGESAFEGCRTLHTIEIPEGVTTIGNSTFSGCTNLGTVKLPDTLTTISGDAFKDCRTIHEMVIPAGVTQVADSAFANAQTRDIDTSKVTAETVKNAIHAHDGTLTSQNPTTEQPATTEAPAPVTEAPPLPAVGTSFIQGAYSYRVMTSKDGDFTAQITGYASAGDRKKAGKVTVPDTVNLENHDYRITSVARGAFKNSKKLKTVVIGNNVETIYRNAFKGCRKLKSVRTGTGLKQIGRSAFSGDRKLKKITIGSLSLTRVWAGAIKGISKKARISVPKSRVKKYKKLFKKNTGFRKGKMKIRKG